MSIANLILVLFSAIAGFVLGFVLGSVFFRLMISTHDALHLIINLIAPALLLMSIIVYRLRSIT